MRCFAEIFKFQSSRDKTNQNKPNPAHCILVGGGGLLLEITNYNDDFSPDLLSANIFYINFPFQGKWERSNNDDGEDENKY